MLAVAADRDLYSLARLCALYQKPMHQIEAALQQIGMQPAWRFDMTVYYSGAQVEQLTQHFAQQDS